MIDPKRAMSIVRSNLMFDEPFWAHIGFGLELVADPTCDAGWTDGIHLAYNPDYVAKGTLEEAAGLFLEECGHNAFGHLWRMAGLDKQDANRAADLALFAFIRKIPGCSIPKELYDPVKDAWCEGKSMEYIYSHIRQQKQQGGGCDQGDTQNQAKPGNQEGKQGGNGKDQGKDKDKQEEPASGLPNGRSEIREPAPEKVAEIKAKWEQLVVEAYQKAQEAGKVPAGIDQLVEKITHPKVNYKIKMRQWMTSFAKNDLSYRRPNPKFIPIGAYRPSRRSEAMGKTVLLWDTSGSLDTAEDRARAAAEFGACHEEIKPESSIIGYFDTELYPGGEFGPDDQIEFKPKGGGGTDIGVGFRWILEQGIDPACVVCITDGYGPWPSNDFPYPVLWLMTTDVEPPFGEAVRV